MGNEIVGLFKRWMPRIPNCSNNSEFSSHPVAAYFIIKGKNTLASTCT